MSQKQPGSWTRGSTPKRYLGFCAFIITLTRMLHVWGFRSCFLLSNNIWSKKVGLCKSDRKQDRTIFSDWSKDCFDNEKIRNSLSYFRPGHKSNLNFFDRVWFQGFHWEFLKHHWPSMRCVLNHDASFKIRFMSKSLRTIYLRQIELQSILMSSEHAMFVSNLVAQNID